MRLIDLDRTCSELERFYNGYTGELRRVASEALDLVCMMPEVDPEGLRPKGRWIDRMVRDWVCSECGGLIRKVRNVDGYCYDDKPNYCPDCGAKMEG
jgi:rubrerythrin